MWGAARGLEYEAEVMLRKSITLFELCQGYAKDGTGAEGSG